jgi:hypothetical protein
MYKTFRSSSDIGYKNKDGQLRKTNSQPHSSRGSNSNQQGIVKGRTPDETHKHFRCKSVPTPLNEVPNQKTDCNEGEGACARETSCPSSPTECSKTYEKDGKKTFSTSLEGSDSVKPKKQTVMDGFRNTLKKSKNDNSGAKLDSSYANSVDSEAENVNQENVTPPTNSNGTERLDNEQNAVS